MPALPPAELCMLKCIFGYDSYRGALLQKSVSQILDVVDEDYKETILSCQSYLQFQWPPMIACKSRPRADGSPKNLLPLYMDNGLFFEFVKASFAQQGRSNECQSFLSHMLIPQSELRDEKAFLC